MGSLLMPGALQQQRGFIARFGRAARFGIRFRWTGWTTIGWPISISPAYTVTLICFWHAWVAVDKVVPWVGIWRAAAEFGSSLAAAAANTPWLWVVYASATGLGVITARETFNVWTVAHAADIRKAKWVVAPAVAAWGLVQTPELFAVISIIPVALAVEGYLGSRNRRLRILRMWAQLNRELPTLFAQIAAKTRRIQSPDDATIEDDVESLASRRPILEHMARWPWCDMNIQGGYTDQTVFASAGRSLVEFDEILHTVTANWPWAYKMELIPVDRSKLDGAHVAIWRVYWDLDFPVEALPQPLWLAGGLRRTGLALAGLPLLRRFATRRS